MGVDFDSDLGKLQRLMAESIAGTTRRNAILNALQTQAGDIIIDIGCGAGHLLPHLAKATGDSGTVYGLDPSKTQLDQAQKRYSSLVIKSLRLRAEVEGTNPEFSQQLIEAAPNAVSTELALYRARLDDLNTKSAILEQRRLQKLNEIQELKIEFQTASNGLALIRREISTLEPLVKSGLAPETRLIALQRDEETSLGNANSAESAQIRLLSGLDEIKEQLNAEQQTYKTSALTDLSAIEGELAELTARIPALESRVERTAKEFNKEFLGHLPIHQDLRSSADKGDPLTHSDPDHEVSKLFLSIAKKIKLNLN